MNARKKTISPKPRVERLIDAVFGNEHDERGEIFVRAAKTVAKPRAHARAAGELMAGLEKRDRWIVIDVLGVHRAHEAKLVHHFRGLRQKFADPRAGLSM